MNRKRIRALALAFMLVGLLTACGNKVTTQAEGENETITQQNVDKEDAGNTAGEQKNTPEQNAPTGATEPSGTKEDGHEKDAGSSGADMIETTTPGHTHEWKPVYRTVHHGAGKTTVHHDAEYKTVHHDAEYKTVHHDAEYKTVHHDAEYKTVHHDAEYKTVHHDAEYKIVHHDAEYKTETKTTGYKVQHEVRVFHYNGHVINPADYNFDFGAYESAFKDYVVYLIGLNVDDACYTDYVWSQVSVSVHDSNKRWWVAEEAITETVKILVKAAWDEKVLVKAAWDEKVLVKAAWDEKVETGAWDERVKVKNAWDEKVKVKDAWDETVTSSKAWDQQVVDHYECSCGERKN